MKDDGMMLYKLLICYNRPCQLLPIPLVPPMHFVMSLPRRLAPVALKRLNYLGHYQGVVKRGDVPQTVHLPHGHLPENSPQDLS